MDHYSNPRNHQLTGDNNYLKINMNSSTCIDNIDVVAKFDGDFISDIRFDGEACAISTASMAMLIDLIKGKSMEEAKEKVNLFFKMMKQEEKLTSEESKKLGDAVLMEYVAQMPARVKCATLSWHSLKVIVEKSGK